MWRSILGEIFSEHLFSLPQMASAEPHAFGRGVTRKVQGFRGNRNNMRRTKVRIGAMLFRKLGKSFRFIAFRRPLRAPAIGHILAS